MVPRNSKSTRICRFLCVQWVLITMPPMSHLILGINEKKKERASEVGTAVSNTICKGKVDLIMLHIKRYQSFFNACKLDMFPPYLLLVVCSREARACCSLPGIIRLEEPTPIAATWHCSVRSRRFRFQRWSF